MEPYQHLRFSVIRHISDKVRNDTVWVPGCGIRWLVNDANPSKEGFSSPPPLPRPGEAVFRFSSSGR